MSSAKAFIGTSGYLYNHWRGVFYPEDKTQNKWLEHYAKFFDTVELNVTFYRLPSENAFKGWYKRTPKKFKFTIKGSRFITHIKKLNEPKEPLKEFFNRAKYLKEKLKMVLWQLPPNFKVNAKRLKDFCELLTSSTYRLVSSSTRNAFEFRHKSWFCREIYEILKKHDFALVICDHPYDLLTEKRKPWSKKETIVVPETADFIYLRRHGATALYASNYSDIQLKEDAKQIKKWLKSSKDVYVYFNNDAYGYAVKNALALKKLLEK